MAFVTLSAFGLAGCAHGPRRMAGVPIDQRPTPTPPPEANVMPNEPIRESSPGARSDSGAADGKSAVEAVMNADERRAAQQRIVADTTAAGAAVRKCAAKTLLPDQESVFETTRSYLIQARAALVRGELWQAESLARKARQLSLSLECH